MSKCTSYCIETINPSDLKAYLRADSCLSERGTGQKYIFILSSFKILAQLSTNQKNYLKLYDQCATGYPVPVPVLANPANIFQSGSSSGSGQILAGLAGFLKIIQKFSKMLKM